MFLIYDLKLPKLVNAQEVLNFWTKIDTTLQGYNKTFWQKALKFSRQSQGFEKLIKQFENEFNYYYDEFDLTIQNRRGSREMIEGW